MSTTVSDLDGIRPGVPEGVRPERRPALLSEDLFSQALVRERQRSERSNRPFILMSLAAKDRLDPAASPVGRNVAEALAASKRGTDTLGWLEWPTTLGVIFSEIGSAEPAQAIEAVRARISAELGRRLGADAVGLALRFRVFPEPTRDDAPSGPPPADPVFHPDLRREERERRWSNWIKRALDVLGSVVLLLALAPLLGLAAGLVWLTSPGPILFRQVRLGKMGRPFKMLKFRTMYVNASEKVHVEFISQYIKNGGGSHTPETNQIFKLTNDSRVTPVGRVLRKTSVDELPQLWNVLMAEMSLVGPRPPLPYELRQYASWHRRRVLEAKPGITGLWQVTGRCRTTFDEMVRLDLRYARKRSLWTDLKILLRTPGAVVGGKGAA